MVANMSFAPVCLGMPGAEMKNEVAAAGRIIRFSSNAYF